MSKSRLSVILPSEAKLKESELRGLLSRWKIFLGELGNKFDVEVYSCDREDYSKKLGVKHIPLPFSLNIVPFGNQIFYNFYLLFRSFFMSKVIRVISASYFILPVIRLMKKNIILSYPYDYEARTKKEFKGLKALTASLREYLSVISANHIIVTTEELKGKMLRRYNRKSTVIPNFVDLNRFRPLNKEKIILFAGRIYWHKGVEYLIRAFGGIEKKFSDYRLILAGYGEIENYRRKARELGINNIEFLGTVDYENMPALMGKTQVFVMPTLHREGNPKSLIEAMASGCVCIASDIKGINNIIKDGINGILVKAGDPGVLAESIAEVLNDNERLHKLSENALETANKYSLDNTLRREIKWIGSVC